MEPPERRQRKRDQGQALQDLAVKTVDRVAAILRVMAAHGPQGAGVTEITDATGLSKGTVHRLLGALVNVGFAFQQPPARRYRLGAGAISLGGAALHDHAAAIMQPALARLAEATGDTIFASVREGPAAICVARAVGDFPVRTLTLDIGDRRPLGVGAGSLALLAALPEEAIPAVLKQNENWLKDYRGFDAKELRALIARTRRAGHSLNEGRIVPAMNAIGVVVRDAAGGPFASLSIAAIKARMGKERLRQLLRLLQEEARALEASLSLSSSSEAAE
jgi:DNA-binding IclR family transcriptional regulator